MNGNDSADESDTRHKEELNKEALKLVQMTVGGLAFTLNVR